MKEKTQISHPRTYVRTYIRMCDSGRFYEWLGVPSIVMIVHRVLLVDMVISNSDSEHEKLSNISPI